MATGMSEWGGGLQRRKQRTLRADTAYQASDSCAQVHCQPSQERGDSALASAARILPSRPNHDQGCVLVGCHL